jgi:hypothetical protein
MVRQFLLAGAAALAVAGMAGAQDCDRDCLIALTDSYLAALAAHDTSAVPLADDVAFVENVTKMQPGEGLWATTTAAPTNFSIHVPDPVNQAAGWLGVLQNNGQPAVVAIRLKLEDGKIAEAEHLIASIREQQLPQFEAPRPGLLADVPEASRKPHDELIAIGASYYDALDDNDGTLMPFAPDCERHENGMITAGPQAGAGPNAMSSGTPRNCAGQLSSNAMAYITSIENRRVFAADPVTGLVMGLSHFVHPMDFEPYEVKNLDGTTTTRDAASFPFQPFDLPAAHIFKIGADGMVHEIEAMGFQAPLHSPTGWE